MKKLFPEASEVPLSVANRATKIVEKYLRLHRVERARDLPEEAKVRLYRDLRFFFDSGGQPTDTGPGVGGGVRRFFVGIWGKIEDFLSMAEMNREIEPIPILGWIGLGDSVRMMILPCGDCPPSEEPA